MDMTKEHVRVLQVYHISPAEMPYYSTVLLLMYNMQTRE